MVISFSAVAFAGVVVFEPFGAPICIGVDIQE